MTVEIKNDMTNLREIDVVILCGGLGKRLRPTFEGPKVLAKVGEKTFLDILIDNLLMHGFKNIILSVGYLKEQIKNHFNYEHNKIHDYTITFSEEEEPLGTGGALKKAKTRIISTPFMVVNGDSICKVNFRSFIEFHIEKKALLSMVLVHSNKAQDYGSVSLDDLQKITDFNEKIAGKSDNLINAGIYLMKKDIFAYMPKQKKFSLEYELFPQIIKNRCYGFLTESEFIDIGTPERYEKAINLLKSDTTTKLRGGSKDMTEKEIFNSKYPQRVLKKNFISDYIEKSIRMKKEILKVKVEIINQVAKEVIDAYKRKNKVLWFGNGGSAADAQHLACELVGKFYLERNALASIALTTNTSELTAIANDYDFDQVFARQVEALVNPGDVVIGISTSGNSNNVINGIKEAKRHRAITIAFVGASGGKLEGDKNVDYLLTVPSEDTPHIQESHIMIGHIICYLVEKELFGGQNDY